MSDNTEIYPQLVVRKNKWGYYAHLKMSGWKYLYLRKSGDLMDGTGAYTDNSGYFEDPNDLLRLLKYNELNYKLEIFIPCLI